jgi:hypothetical protein
MNKSKFKSSNKLLYNGHHMITIITLFLLITIFFIHSLLAYAQGNVHPRSLVINSTMISKTISSTTRFVASPESSMISFGIIPHSSKVSYLTSSAALPFIRIPSFTITNASLSISYDTLTGAWTSNIVEQPVIKISKVILSANRLNVPHSLK